MFNFNITIDICVFICYNTTNVTMPQGKSFGGIMDDGTGDSTCFTITIHN